MPRPRGYCNGACVDFDTPERCGSCSNDCGSDYCFQEVCSDGAAEGIEGVSASLSGSTYQGTYTFERRLVDADFVVCEASFDLTARVVDDPSCPACTVYEQSATRIN